MAKNRTEAPAEGREESIINPAKVQRVEPWPEPPEPIKSGELRLVEEHARAQGVQTWELAALRQAASWAPGKQVSAEQFGQALARLRGRACGSGRI